MQTQSKLAEIQFKVNEVNEPLRNLGQRMNDPRTGLMKPQVWLPPEIKEMLIEEYNRSDDERTGIALVKYFNPDGGETWWFSEYDEEGDRFFGLCKLHEASLGYASNKEMRGIRSNQLKIPLERDLWFQPTHLSEVN